MNRDLRPLGWLLSSPVSVQADRAAEGRIFRSRVTRKLQSQSPSEEASLPQLL